MALCLKCGNHKNDSDFYSYKGNRIYQGLKINKSIKNNISCFKHLNYSVQDLKFHLESKFEP